MKRKNGSGGETKTDIVSDKFVHTFKDGFAITQADLKAGQDELKAFFIINLVRYSKVMKETFRSQNIATKHLIGSGLSTEDEILEIYTSQQLQSARTPRITAKQLRGQPIEDAALTKANLRALAWRDLRGKIRNSLQCLAGREKGWSLLGTNREDELIKMVRTSYGVECAHEISRTHQIPYRMVEQLLARKKRSELDRIKPEKQEKKEKLKRKVNKR